MRLGRLLHVDADATAQQRDGRVLQLVTRAALHAADYHIAHNNCQRLMTSNYAQAWSECKQLAEVEEFKDIRAK